MTLDEVANAVRRIDEIKDDYEAAHAAEDKLRADFIWYVAESCPEEMSNMAREILKTDEIEFPRHCA